MEQVSLSGESTRARLAPTGDLSWPALSVRPVFAEVHSDDQERSATFDAAPWLAQASDREVLALAQEEWCNSYEADAVARFFEADSHAVGEVFAYVDAGARDLAGEVVGFECSLEFGEATAWLKEQRPHLLPWFDGDCSFATSHYQVVPGEFISDELGGSQGLEWEVREAASAQTLETFYERDGHSEEDAIAYAGQLESARAR